MDLTTLDDEALAAHLNAVINEQERRVRIASAPAQVAALAARYVADGGDRAVIVDALLLTHPPLE